MVMMFYFGEDFSLAVGYLEQVWGPRQWAQRVQASQSIWPLEIYFYRIHYFSPIGLLQIRFWKVFQLGDQPLAIA